MTRKDIPNLISIIRIILVLPIAYYLWQQEFLFALILFLVGGLSDGLDGLLARRFNWQTELGVILDPMGDKLMMLASYLLLGWHQLLPWWLVVVVISRDVLLVAGTFIYKQFIGNAKLKPIWLSKINTTLQIILVLLVMLAQVIPVTRVFTDMLIVSVTIMTVLSGFAYVSEWGSRAMKEMKGNNI